MLLDPAGVDVGLSDGDEILALIINASYLILKYGTIYA